MADTIVKSFEFKIKHTAKFAKKANEALEHSRFAYNCALEHRIMRYHQGKPIGYVEQSRELTEARTLPWLNTVPRKIQQDALKRLDRAYQSFFGRVKKGETPGFPRFKGARRYSTFSQQIDPRKNCPLTGDVLKVPGVGVVRIRLSRHIEGTVKHLRITRRADGWYAILVCESPIPKPLPVTGLSIGVDVGLTNFATLSNGEVIRNPQYLRNAERALKRSQRVLSAKKKGSANRIKAKQRLAVRSLGIQRARKDFHHKTALDLVKRFDTIAVEDLKILNMVKNHTLANSIMDAGWGQFLTITQFKAENAGRVFKKVNPAYTSQTCSACGHRQKMPLRVREFVCSSCGFTLCRDVNAAINIGLGKPKSTPAESHGTRRSRNRQGPFTTMVPFFSA